MRQAKGVYDTTVDDPNTPISEGLREHPELGEGELTTQLWAGSYDEAKAAVEARNVPGETIYLTFSQQLMGGVGQKDTRNSLKLPSEWLEEGAYVRAAHAACWLGWVALHAKTTTADELLSDGGIIHNLIHLCMDERYPEDLVAAPENAKLREVVLEKLPAMLRDLEKRTPGFDKWKAE